MKHSTLIKIAVVVWIISQIKYAKGQAPVADFTVSVDTACIGTLLQLTDLSSNTPTSWLWTLPGSTIGTSTLQNPVVSYANAGSYNVILSASNASGSNNKMRLGLIKVVNLAAPQIAINNSDPILCPGDPATLMASGANSFTWNTNQFGPTLSISPMANVIYSVTGVGNNGCAGTGSILVTVSPNPTVTIVSPTIVCLGSGIILTASGANSYSWSTGAMTSTLLVSPTTNTTYLVKGYSNASCSDTASVLLRVEICNALEEHSAQLQLQIFPNPVKDKLRLILNASNNQEIIIQDCFGRKIMTSVLSGENPEIDLSAFSSGIYVMTVFQDEQSFHIRLVKE